MSETDAGDVALALAERFERANIPYAIGGALAYGMYSVPRATLDVDMNVFVEPDDLAGVLAVVREMGVAVDDVAARRDAEKEGLFVVWAGIVRIDFFTPSIPFSWEALKTRCRLTFRGRDAWFLSAEALAVFKLLFFRGKDVSDLERLVGTAGRTLDHAYVRRSVVDMLGPDDARVHTWDELVKQHLPS